MAAVLMLAVGFWMAGAGVLLWQVAVFLRYGEWPPYSVVRALQWAGVPWAFEPTDMLGAHKILEWMPFSGSLFLVGALVIFVGAALERPRRKPLR